MPEEELTHWREQTLGWCIVGLLFVAIVGFTPFSDLSRSLSGGGEFSRQAAYSLTLLVVVGCSLHHRDAGRIIAMPGSMMVLLGWCWLSLVWSVAPDVALRRLILVTMIIWIVFRSIDELGFERSMAWLRTFLAVLLVGNLLAVKLSPVGVHHFAEVGDPNLVGNWKGLTNHKNFAGTVCAVTILVFTFGATDSRWWYRLAVIGGSAVFLYESHSKTSMGMVVFALAAGLAFLAYNPAYRLLVIPAAILAFCAAAIVLAMGWFVPVNPIDDPSSFTGRGEIWGAVLRYILDHPLLGAGYGSFWNIGPSSPINEYAVDWVALLANGHNGYLDLVAQLGIPGLIIVLWAVFGVPVARLVMSYSVPKSAGALVIALLAFFLGHNMTESSLLDRDMVGQIFTMIAVALAGNLLHERSAADAAPLYGSHSHLAEQS